jgi:hypothetical protein
MSVRQLFAKFSFFPYGIIFNYSGASAFDCRNSGEKQNGIIESKKT